jgi:DNA-binding CsgD family transcriptional regulator
MGRIDEACALADVPAQQAQCQAYAGQTAKAADLLDQMLAARPELGTGDDETPMYTDVLWLEAATCIAHDAAATRLRRRLAGSAAVTTGTRVPTCIARHLAAAAALLHQPEEARAWYLTALEQTSAMGFRPELALSHLGLAELLLTSFSHTSEEATAYLTLAAAEFGAMGMRPALAHAEHLRARISASTPMNASAPSEPTPAGLTPREVEVLRLLAAGRSNAEIAATFVVSIRTAERHIANIYAKLGVEGKVARVAATAFALRHGLVAADGPDAT